MNLAVGYVRCSTEMQDDSVPQQKHAIQEWAEKNGFNVINWYVDEGRSGTSFEKRPGFMQLVQDVEAYPLFKTVLVYDESRWGRPNNPRENTYWKVHFQRFNVQVRVINSQSRNENDIGSFVVEVVESAEASEYSKKLSRATLRGAFANSEKGFSSGGFAPYGYKRVAIDKITGKRRDLGILHDQEGNEHDEPSNKKQEKVVWELGDPFEVQVVRRIFDLRLKGYGYVLIADALNEDHIPCAKRGRWRNKDMKWSSGTIRYLITNKTYVGTRVYNRHPQSHQKSIVKGKWENHEKDFVIKENAHPAIIPKEVFEKANLIGKDRWGKGSKSIVKSQYLLSGLIRCGKCGFNYQGWTSTTHGGKTRIGYYSDGGYLNKGKSVCSPLHVRQDKLEGFVISKIKEYFLRPDIFSKLHDVIERKIARLGLSKTSKIEQLDAQRQDIDTRIDTLVKVMERGVDIENIIRRIRELEEERKRMDEERAKCLETQIPRQAVQDLAGQIAQELTNLETALQGGNFFERKQLIRQFVRQIIVDRIRMKAVCYIKKIPTVTHKLMGFLEPSESSVIIVAGVGTATIPQA